MMLRRRSSMAQVAASLWPILVLCSLIQLQSSMRVVEAFLARNFFPVTNEAVVGITMPRLTSTPLHQNKLLCRMVLGETTASAPHMNVVPEVADNISPIVQDPQRQNGQPQQHHHKHQHQPKPPEQSHRQRRKPKEEGRIVAGLTAVGAKKGHEQQYGTSRMHSSTKYHQRKGLVVRVYQEAQREARSGRLEKAEELFRRCLTMDRKDGRSWLQLAQLASRRGRQEEARSYFAQGVSECPESVHLLQSWAMLEHKAGDLEKACELFEKGMAQDPGNPYIAHAWGQLERKRADHDKARTLYMDSLRLYGPWAQVYMALAELEVETGHVEMARQIFEEALRLCAQNTHKLLVAWAKLEEENFGDWEKATELLLRAMEEGGPDFTDATVALAHLEMKKGNKERAVDILQQSKHQGGAGGSLFNTWASVEAKAGNLETAIKLLSEACVLFPDDFSLLQTLGTLEVKLGHHEKARECFSQSAAIRPHVVTYNAWAIMEERLAHDMRGPMRQVQIMRARKLFMLGMAADPSHGPLYNAYGRMEEKIGNLTGAQEVFRMGVEAHCPDMPSVLNGWAMLSLKQRNYAQARSLLQRGLSENKLGKNVGFLYHSLGMLEMKLGKIEDAWRVFKEATDKYPRNSQLLVGAGLAAEKRGEVDSARGLFKGGVECDRLHHQAWQAWAVMEHRQGNVNTARDLFRLGLKANPDYGALWQAYGVLEFHEENWDVARSLFAEGIRRDPGHVMLFQAWAVLEVKLADYEKGKEMIKEGLRVDSRHGACWSIYGYIEEKCGNVDEARRVFEMGLKQAPDHAPLFRVYGDFERRQGNTDKARSLYQRAISLDPHHPQAYVVLGLMELYSGNAEGARMVREASQAVFGHDFEFTKQREAVSSFDNAELGELHSI